MRLHLVLASSLFCTALLAPPAHAGRLGDFVRRVVPARTVSPAKKTVPATSAWAKHDKMVEVVRRDRLPIYGLDEFEALGRVAKIGAGGSLEVVHPTRPLVSDGGYKGQSLLAAGKAALLDARTVLEDIYAHHVDAMLGKITSQEMSSRISQDHERLQQIERFARASGNIDEHGNYSAAAWSRALQSHATFESVGITLTGEQGRIRAGVPYVGPFWQTRAGVTKALESIDFLVRKYEVAQAKEKESIGASLSVR